MLLVCFSSINGYSFLEGNELGYVYITHSMTGTERRMMLTLSYFDGQIGSSFLGNILSGPHIFSLTILD